MAAAPLRACAHLGVHNGAAADVCAQLLGLSSNLMSERRVVFEAAADAQLSSRAGRATEAIAWLDHSLISRRDDDQVSGGPVPRRRLIGASQGLTVTFLPHSAWNSGLLLSMHPSLLKCIVC
jgi:hypothetical protein